MHRPSNIPNWVKFPDDDWMEISPEDAGLDPGGFREFLEGLDVREAAFGGEDHGDGRWGAVLTRGGCLLRSWGDRHYRAQTASVGKAFAWAAFGFAVEDGLVDPDAPIHETWTGEGELSHPHKLMNAGHHRKLTWRHLLGSRERSEHYGGFPIELGIRWSEKRHGLEEADAVPGIPRMGQVDRRPLLRLLFTRRAGHSGHLQQRRLLAAGTGPHGPLGPRPEGPARRAAIRQDRRPGPPLAVAPRAAGSRTRSTSIPPSPTPIRTSTRRTIWAATPSAAPPAGS